MQNFKSSETLDLLKNCAEFENSNMKFVQIALFSQIFEWLRSKNDEFQKYRKKHKVNDRRDSLNLHLFQKVGESPENELKILKAFPALASSEFLACSVREAIIPFLIDSAWALKSTNIFLHNEVVFIGGVDTSPNEYLRSQCRS